jgi:quercetin dioxygenase-like cupin family protein
MAEISSFQRRPLAPSLHCQQQKQAQATETSNRNKQHKGASMKKRIVGAAFLAGLAVLVTASTAQATPPIGVTSTAAFGTFEDGIQAKTHTSPPRDSNWQARIDIEGATDVHVVENKIAPGGSLGWRSHPGPLIAVVKTGEVVLYSADGSTCTSKVIKAGSGWVEQGGAVHTVHNEGGVEAVIEATVLVPQGQNRRHDEPSPGGNCPEG